MWWLYTILWWKRTQNFKFIIFISQEDQHRKYQKSKRTGVELWWYDLDNEISPASFCFPTSRCIFHNHLPQYNATTLRVPLEMNKLRHKITNYQAEVAQKFISEEAQSHHESFQTRGFFDKRQQQYVPWAPHQYVKKNIIWLSFIR